MRLVPWKLPSFAIRDAKIRTLFLALSVCVTLCHFMSLCVTFILKIIWKCQKLYVTLQIENQQV